MRELAGRDGPRSGFPRRARGWGWAFGRRERGSLRGPHAPHGPHARDDRHESPAPDGLHGALVVSYRARPGEDERLRGPE
ncbi:hypothetical protein [Streptomyces sp. 5-10]|uniref:hypothetical protein n=1 Tax=Streptomyces sp. 5-10 TaxID=878925 RepID=UPI00168B0E2E|nr:hypothetical protein [Streptomyces sp. 5-10]MBD3010498.1 hypothetical protein [Streptomyces sp. 5-10]